MLYIEGEGRNKHVPTLTEKLRTTDGFWGKGSQFSLRGVAPGGSRGSSRYSHPPFLSIFKLGSTDS